MSSVFHLSPPSSVAVDGVIRVHEFKYAVVTNTLQRSAWWKVDLQTQVQSARVTLYFRTDYKYRRNGVQLYTSTTNSSDPKEGNLCHSVSGRADGTNIPDVLNVTCPGTWRYLTVYTETDNDKYGPVLDFVEVQVWIPCPSGYYGSNCDQSCAARHCKSDSSCDDIGGLCVGGCAAGYQGTDCTQACAPEKYGADCGQLCTARHCKMNSSCHDKIHGQCVGGCAAGYQGGDCTQVCDPGRYGEGCGQYCMNRRCKTQSDTCDHVTGMCPDGCESGFIGSDCFLTCTSMMYGPNCASNCSSRHCKTPSSTCDRVTGQCPGGCEDGWTEIDCSRTCTSMMYGPNCASNCSSRNCKTPSSTCDRVTGQCPDGCEDGWTEIDCSRTCTRMMYGPNCASNCSSRHCKTPSSTCDRVTGQCPGGCEDGWTETDCSRTCTSMMYGPNCASNCSSRHCKTPSSTCDRVTGQCTGGCEDGWTEIDCSRTLQNEQGPSEFPVSAVVGTVAGLLVAIVVIVVVVLVRRRRQRFHDDINKQVAEFHPKVQENSIYENVALDEGTTVNQEPQLKAKPATPASSGTPHDARDKDQEEEDFNEDVQSPDNCYYNTGADAAIRDVAVPELAATVATLRERKDGFEKEYQRLPAGFTAPYQDSQEPENSGKNKFRGYYPYDHNRVRLTPLADTPGSDYINASFMHSYNQRKTYIASQAPNKKTVGDFWRMIWEHSCSAVVMLTGLTEESRVKCERYWPTDGAMIIGLFKIEVEVTQSRANFTTRHMKVTSNTTGESRTVVQFHFTSWPDHDVPNILALVSYIWLVRQTVAETDGPLLVHCSAGIGRTGTYIAVDSLIDQARGEGVVDVFGYVSAMRGQRKNMIQTPAQYECVFLCLVEMTTYGCTSMDVSNYTNSYSCSGMETTMDGKTFRQLSEMLVLETREDAPTRHRMWVDGNADFIVRVGPSLTCVRGYLQASAPPPELVKLLWKLVEENDVHNIIVVTPDMGLVEAEGRSKTHGEITLTTTSQTNLSTDVTMNNLQLATKAGSPRQIKMVDVNASLTMEVMTSHLLNHAQLQEISTQPDPVVVVHSDTDRKLAVSLCIMGNILSGIREDTRVDVIGHVRTFLRCCPDFRFTQSDVQMFHDFAQQCILRTDPANTYANI